MAVRDVVQAAAGVSTSLPETTYLATHPSYFQNYVKSDEGAYTIGIGTQAYIGKYDVEGSVVWGIKGNNNIYYYNGATDSSGNIYAVGADLFTYATKRPLVSKYSSSGSLIWSSGLYSGSQNIYLYGAAVSSTAVYVCGHNQSANQGVLFKYDLSGNLLWQKNITVSQTAFFNCKVDDNGDVYVAGRNFARTRPGMYVTKISSAGSQLWGTTIYDDTGNYDSFAGGLVLVGSDVYVCGGENSNKTLVAKLDASTGSMSIVKQTSSGYASLTLPFYSGIDVLSDGSIAVHYQKNIANQATGFLITDGNLSTTSITRLFYRTDLSQGMESKTLISSGEANLILAGKGSGIGGYILRLRTDGTGLGTYGNYTYTTSNTASLQSSTRTSDPNTGMSTSSYSTWAPSVNSVSTTLTVSLYQPI